MAENSKSPLGYYLEQINLLFQDYSTGDKNFPLNGQWGFTLDPAIQLISIMGIILLIIQTIRKKSDPFWLVIFFTFCILLFIPFVLLYRTASVWRAYVTLPLIYLFAAFFIAQAATFLKKITKKTYRLKGLRKIFLVAITLIYFLVSIPWFLSYSKTYTEKWNVYENTICQYATNIINTKIPRGSTILMPDEMCFPLITVLYDSNQYQFISLKSDNARPVVNAGSYLIVFNSMAHSGYFRKDIQEIAEQITIDHPVELVSSQSTSQPVVYLIK
jgi:hypothetical protein